MSVLRIGGREPELVGCYLKRPEQLVDRIAGTEPTCLLDLELLLQTAETKSDFRCCVRESAFIFSTAKHLQKSAASPPIKGLDRTMAEIYWTR